VLTVVAIWLLIGALFGIPRARARYRATLAKYPNLIQTEPMATRLEALTDAALEFLKWTLLGLISAVSYVAWLLLELAIANRKNLERPNVLGALGFSILIFVLGVIALDQRELEKAE